MAMTLKELPLGQAARITRVNGEGSLRQHILDMGVIPGVHVFPQKYAPMGDPLELRIHGYELTLRLDDAAQIEVEPVSPEELDSPAEEDPWKDEYSGPIEHPGLGEEGRYHTSDPTHADTEHPPLGKRPLSFVLVGNQNCGKTTLFNQLTGSNQRVGNFPGVTVDRKDGQIKGFPFTTVTDLPGIYSLSPFTNEELVSRQCILEDQPDGIINIVDATSIERSLYLTMQLLELGIPMVLALNMMDEVKQNHGTIRINEMEHMLGIPVIPISAKRNEGVDELVAHALHVAHYREGPTRQDFCPPTENGGAVHRGLHAIMHLIEDHAKRTWIPIRFAASKLAESDPFVIKSLGLDKNEQETIEHIVSQMEEERGLDRHATIADMRYNYIMHLTRKTVVHPHESKERIRSRRIDRILTGRYTALPAFIGIMGLVFYFTFSSLGAWLQELAEGGIDWLTKITDQALTRWEIAPSIHSLIIDGVFSGVGSVLVFLPLIVVLFFFLSMMEDTGYMARVAFVMDRLLRRLGLSGRSIVPLLLGFGCSVPSIMASRTLPSQRDRKLTIMLTPFMSCTAKIPIYAFFAAAFFPHHAVWVMSSLYVLGILVGILVAFISKNTLFKGEAVPFVMELPNYRLPMAKNVIKLLWEKAKDFLVKAFTVIFLASMVIWFLQTFDYRLQMVPEGMASESILAHLASFLSPLFAPLGFGDWRVVTALVSGFMAKETVVSTLGALFQGVSMSEVFSPAVAYCLLVFCLLYTPCVAAISTIKRELGALWATLITVGQCVIAWVVAYAFHLILV